MTIRKTLGAGLVGLTLVAMMPSASEAAHRHSRSCGHRVQKSEHGYGYRHDYRPSYRTYDRDDYVDYDAPYVARHGSGRYSERSRYGYRDYGYRDRGYSRSYHEPRYYGSRRGGYHYHGRSRCYSSHRPHIHFGIHFGF